MNHVKVGMLVVAAMLATPHAAAVDSSSIGIGMISDWDPGNLEILRT
jgi:hypothetical protein